MSDQTDAVAGLARCARDDALLADVSVEDLSLALASVTVALALRNETTPRGVLDAMWQTHLGDDKWDAIRERYLETHG